MKNKLNYNLLNILLILCIILLGYKTINLWKGIVVELFSILFPFLLAFIIAYALYPIINLLKKIGVRNNIAKVSIILFVICFIIFIFYITIPLVYDELLSLLSLSSNILESISTKYNINLSKITKLINGPLNNIISLIGKYISEGMINIIYSSIEIITKVIVCFIVTIYLIFDMDYIRKTIKKFLYKHNKKILNYVIGLDNEMENYLEGTLIFILIQLLEYSIVFLLIGHPNWLILAILASITSVVPYFGALITNIIAVVLASAISTKLFLLTCLVCLIFPNLDGYILSPKIYKKTNNINPIISIFFTVLFGKLFGIIGIFLAIPIYIFLKYSVNYFYKKEH